MNLKQLEKYAKPDLFFVLAKPIFILIAGKVVSVILMKFLDKLFEKSKLDEGIRGFLKQMVKIAVFLITVITAAHDLGLDTASLVTVLGVVSLAFSLSLQSILTNIFSGIVILMTKPFVVGDFVEIAGVMGTVTGITLMRTRLNTPDNKVELIPNSDVSSGRISNFSNQDVRRVDLEISASYEDSTEKVLSALREVVDGDERVLRDEDHLPVVRLFRFNANDITYVVKVWCPTAEYWNVYYDTLENVRKVYAEREISFSYPHTVVHIETEKKK